MTTPRHVPEDPPESLHAELAPRVLDALRDAEVLVDERTTHLRPSIEEVLGVVLPLLTWCRDRTPASARGLVGIAAPPGAGKSVLAAWLAAAAEVLGWRTFAFLPLDGYHFPNAVLETRTGTDPDGNAVAMPKLKGTPASFDARRLLGDLRALVGSREERLLPAYSRTLHDPMPGRIRIGPEVAWVFIEGNFLFLDQPPWRDIRELLDRKVYLDAPDHALKQRLADRHSSAGRDAQWFEEHFRITDQPDIRLVRAAAHFADLTFTTGPHGRLRPES